MYKKILVPVDGSELAECVLPQLKSLADKESEIILFHVIEPSPDLSTYPLEMRLKWEKPPVVPPETPSDAYQKWKENSPEDYTAQMRKYSEKQVDSYLGNLKEKLGNEGLKATTKIGMGTPAIQIVDYAINNQVDLILMATHGRSGVLRWALGSVADKVLHSSPVPVMSVRPKECQLPSVASAA